MKKNITNGNITKMTRNELAYLYAFNKTFYYSDDDVKYGITPFDRAYIHALEDKCRDELIMFNKYHLLPNMKTKDINKIIQYQKSFIQGSV